LEFELLAPAWHSSSFVAGYPGYGAKAPDGTRVIESTNYGPFNYADQVSCRSGGALQKQAVALPLFVSRPLSLRGVPQWLTHSKRFINRLSFRTGGLGIYV
jgi:hypothetical protein